MSRPPSSAAVAGAGDGAGRAEPSGGDQGGQLGRKAAQIRLPGPRAVVREEVGEAEHPRVLALSGRLSPLHSRFRLLSLSLNLRNLKHHHHKYLILGGQQAYLLGPRNRRILMGMRLSLGITFGNQLSRTGH